MDVPTDDNSVEIEADDGTMFQLRECPRKFCSDMIDAVNLSQLGEHHMPAVGGVMDQAAWWVDCWMAVRSDMNRIEFEKQQRESRRGRR